MLNNNGSQIIDINAIGKGNKKAVFFDSPARMKNITENAAASIKYNIYYFPTCMPVFAAMKSLMNKKPTQIVVAIPTVL